MKTIAIVLGSLAILSFWASRILEARLINLTNQAVSAEQNCKNLKSLSHRESEE